MKWGELDLGWKAAFETAWDAFKSGTIPIGAAVLDDRGVLVSAGQNKVFNGTQNTMQIYNHQLAHAEINAILKLSEYEHPKIRKYTLYAVMEPCPLCFGAIVMGSIRHLKFAARDGWAGATGLNNSITYIKQKNINVEGPFRELEMVQLTIQTYFELEHDSPRFLLDKWSEYCPEGVKLGEELFRGGVLRTLANKICDAQNVFDHLAERLGI